MSINTPTEPAQRSGPLGPVVDQPIKRPEPGAVQISRYVWRLPSGAYETRGYPAVEVQKGAR